jgi:hypothetical protein
MHATNAAVTSPRRAAGASSFNSCCALMNASPWPVPAASDPSASKPSECAGEASTSMTSPPARIARPIACGVGPDPNRLRAAICAQLDATTESAARVARSATFFVSSKSPA